MGEGQDGDERMQPANNISKARQLRNNPTDAERALWNILRGRQVSGCRFRRQAPIGPYIVDFVCFDYRLIIEVDGGQHMEQANYDAGRTEWLKSKGFKVIRFWNNQVLEETDTVREAIFVAVQRLSPPSHLTGSQG